MLTQCRWAWPRFLPTVALPSSGLSHSVNSVTWTLCTEWQSCAGRQSTVASWPKLLALPKRRQQDSTGQGKTLANSKNIPFSAKSAPLKLGNSLMTFQGFLAKNTNQVPLSKLDNRRGSSLVDYVKKKRKTISWMKEKENLLGQKATTAYSSLCELTLPKRVGGRDVKPSPTGIYSLCLNEGDRRAKIFQDKVFCRCKLAYQ